MLARVRDPHTVPNLVHASSLSSQFPHWIHLDLDLRALVKFTDVDSAGGCDNPLELASLTLGHFMHFVERFLSFLHQILLPPIG